jgi:hypothetical protein
MNNDEKILELKAQIKEKKLDNSKYGGNGLLYDICRLCLYADFQTG